MISDRKEAFTILDLLRTFVSTPKGSKFANELIVILEYYVEKTLTQKQPINYNKNLFHKLITYSCLARELQ